MSEIRKTEHQFKADIESIGRYLALRHFGLGWLLLEYEVNSSFLARCCKGTPLENIVGDYYYRKVRRKCRKYADKINNRTSSRAL